MTIRTLIIGFIFCALISCHSSHRKTIENTNNTDSVNHSDKKEVSLNKIVELPTTLAYLESKISIINIPTDFKINKHSADSLEELYLKLDSLQVAYFYSTEELKKYYDYFNFHSYFLGYSSLINDLIGIYIINADGYHAIYLDCFILNKEGKVLDFFRPAFHESDIYYGYFAHGEFLSDSTYSFHESTYNVIDQVNNIGTVDSSFQSIVIKTNGLIQATVISEGADTIYGFFD